MSLKNKWRKKKRNDLGRDILMKENWIDLINNQATTFSLPYVFCLDDCFTLQNCRKNDNAVGAI